MSRLGMAMAMLSAAVAASGNLDVPQPRHRRREMASEPIKSTGNPAGSKYKNRKRKSKPLFRA